MVYVGYWYDAANGIITKAKTLILPLKPADLDNVLDEIDLRESNIRGSIAYIYPGEDRPAPLTVKEFMHGSTFRVEVLTEKPTLSSDIKTAVQKAEKVVDKLEADRSLGGVVDFSYVSLFSVPPSGAPRFYPWSVLIEVTFRKPLSDT